MREYKKLIQQANELLRKKRYKEAIKRYSEAIKLNSESAQTYNNRGNLYGVIGEYKKAIKDYTKAIALDLDFEQAYYNRGMAYRKLKKDKEAIKDFDKAIGLNEDFEQAYNSRGNAYKSLGYYKEAIFSNYDKAIELNPEFGEAYNNRGSSYGMLGEYKKALKDLNKAIELNPNLEKVYNNRGIVNEKLDKYKQSLKDFTQAIELNPNFEPAYNNRGNTYHLLNRHDRAIKDIDRAIELNPKYESAYYNRAMIYTKFKKYEQAIEDYTKAIEIKPSFEQAYRNRAEVYKLSRDYKKAVKDYTKIIELNPEAKNAYYNRAVIYKRLGKDQSARDDLDKVIKLKPEKAEVYYEMINLLEEEAEYGKYIKQGLNKGRDKLALAVDLFAGFDFDKEKNLYYYTSLEELKSVLESKKLSLKKINLLEDVTVRDNLITLVENLENKLEVKDLNVANKRQFFREIELHIKDIFAENFDNSSYIEEFIARVALEINQKIANRIRKSFENNFNKLYLDSEESVIDCINKFIKQLKEKNIELDEYDYSDLKKIAKKYFDIQLAEIIQQWCEVYLLSLTKEADYWPLWSKYPDGDGYNLEFEADKLSKEINDLKLEKNYFDSCYCGEVIYEKEKFYDSLKNLSTKCNKFLDETDKSLKDNDKQQERSLTELELKYIFITQIFLQAIFISRKDFAVEKEYRMAFLLFDKEQDENEKEVGVQKEDSLVLEEIKADKPKVEFGINKDNLLTPIIKLPLTAGGDLKVLSSIGIGPNNAAGIARRSLEYFLKEKEIAAELKESDTI